LSNDFLENLGFFLKTTDIYHCQIAHIGIFE